jgi:nucleoside-diphosphate-sugar epimerase
MSKELHVVFGTGPAGRAVGAELVHAGTPLRMVNRSGKAVLPGVETVGGDVTDPSFANEAAAGAATVYFCLNAPNYHRWPEEFPPLQDAVLSAASAADARLVALENLYAYGPTNGAPMTELTPANPANKKSVTRARMSANLLAAHERGDVEVVIGRASDFVGPGVLSSAMGEYVFGPALVGKRAQTMGRPDTAHTYSYVPDLGRNLVLLGNQADAYGRAWHLPNPETLTTREVITRIYAAAGREPRLMVAKRPMLRVMGLFNSNVRELLATYYQFDAPFVVDHTAFQTAYGGHITEWDELIQTTLDSYRSTPGAERTSS